jgi:hypothetical protein
MTAFLHPAIRLAAISLIVVSGCAAPPPLDPADGACAACEFSYRLCLEKDDFGPCSEMRRFCYGWCEKGGNCEDGCEGARWGCEAALTTRSTCNRLAEACPAWCGGQDGPATPD